jgi:hypothetical protein
MIAGYKSGQVLSILKIKQRAGYSDSLKETLRAPLLQQ